MTPEDDLLRCPFCGGKPMLLHGVPPYGVLCLTPTCEAELQGFGSEADAIAAWNTRLSAARQPAASVSDDLRRLSANAARGPWWWSAGEIFGVENSHGVCDLVACGLREGESDPEDAAFIVAAVNYVRDLLALPRAHQPAAPAWGEMSALADELEAMAFEKAALEPWADRFAAEGVKPVHAAVAARIKGQRYGYSHAAQLLRSRLAALHQPAGAKGENYPTTAEMDEWYAWAREWSASAFLAGETSDTDADLKTQLYSDLCRLGNHFAAWKDGLALPPPAPGLDPEAPVRVVDPEAFGSEPYPSKAAPYPYAQQDRPPADASQSGRTADEDAEQEADRYILGADLLGGAAVLALPLLVQRAREMAAIARTGKMRDLTQPYAAILLEECARRASQSAEVERVGWRPIETAPRDETWVLVYADKFGEPSVRAAFWSPDGDWFDSEVAGNPVWPTPTHWQALYVPQGEKEDG